MAVTKRNTEKTVDKEETPEKEVKAPTKQDKKSCNKKGCSWFSCLLYTLVAISSFCYVVIGFVIYVKHYQPDLYVEKVESLISSIQIPQLQQLSEATPAAAATTSTPVPEPPKEETLHKKFNIDELDDVINLEEKAFIKNALKEEEIKEKLKDKPELLKVKEYYEEPVGQMIRRISLEQQIVLFINSNDERSKVARLAISRSKVPFGVMEVDNEPRANEIKAALFRMTAQQTFPYIFINGRFFGNSFALKDAMQNGSFYEMVDSEENKKEWLELKEEYHQKILKRKQQNEERQRKKLEKIKKKIEEAEEKKAEAEAEKKAEL